MFDALTAALFNDPNLSEPATYKTADGDTFPGDSFPVRVIRATRSTDFRFERTTLRSDAVTFKVRVSDVAQPAAGDTITADGETFAVQGTPARTMRGQAWVLEAVLA